MAELIVLRVIHVVGGVFWVGTMLFNAFFLGPAMAMSGPAAGPVAMGLQKRHLFTAMPVTAILTILAGLRLLMITSSRFSGEFFRSPMGMTFSASGALAIIAFIYGMAVTRPSMAKVAALGQQAATADGPTREKLGAEIRAAQDRARQSTVAVAVMLAITAIGMSIARYI